MSATIFARTLAIAGLAAGLTTAALAQSGTSPAAPVAPAPAATAPAAPPAPPVSAEHLELATEVVRLSGMSRSIDLIVPETVARARFGFTQMRPELGPEIAKSIEALKPDFDAMSAEAIKVAATAFARRLTQPDLVELKKFFGSDIGKRFVAAQPGIIDEMYRSLDQFSNTLSQTVVDKVRDDMKKKGHSL